LIKLAKVKQFDKMLTKSFEAIILLITQDPSVTVRRRLLEKLAEVLPTQRLLPRWNMVPAMCACDPQPENIALASCFGLGKGSELME
jgi:sister-chromatid-cohesion protein PDS5